MADDAPARSAAVAPPHRGVLCLHGFAGTRVEIQPVADALARRGYDVEVPLLAGHGIDVATLETTGWEAWLRSAEAALDALVARTGGPVAIVGFSMGGLLALALACRAPERIAALVILSAPFRLRRSRAFGIRLLAGLPRWARRGPLRAMPKMRGSDVGHPDLRGKVLGLPAMPIQGLIALLDLIAHVRAEVARGRVVAPTLIVHGRRDRTAPFAASVELARALGTVAAPPLWLERSQHIVALDVEQDALFEAIARFLDGHARWSTATAPHP